MQIRAPVASRGFLVRLVQNPAADTGLRIKAANMERDAQRVHHYAKQAAAAGIALALTSSEFGDYPYALDPKSAEVKPKIMGMIKRSIALSNSTMMLGWMNSATCHQMRGEGFPGPFNP